MKILLLFPLFVVLSTAAIQEHEATLDVFFAGKCASCIHVVSHLPDAIPHYGLEKSISMLCGETKFPSCEEKMKHSLTYLTSAFKEEAKTSAVHCHNMGWCRRGGVFELPQPSLAVQPLPQQVEQDMTCSVCTNAFAKVKKVAGGRDAFNVLPALCGQVPDKYKGLCMLFNSTQIASLLKSEPLSGCKQLHMCSAAVTANAVHSTSSIIGNAVTQASATTIATTTSLSNAKCQACQWAVSAIEAYFAQSATTDELSRILQELCTVLPGDYAEVCQNFVLVYMPQALGWMIDNLTPPVVCEQISFCTY